MALSECIIHGGPYAVTNSWNHAADPATTITMDGGASTTHPATNLVNGNPGKPGRYLTDAADRKTLFDFGSAKKVTLVTIHGHNFTTGITSIQLWHNSVNNFGTATKLLQFLPLYKRPAVYGYHPTGATMRYWWVVGVGTNGVAPWEGEVTLSNPVPLSTRPLIPIETEHAEAHVEHYTGAGRSVSYEKTAWESRHVMLTFEDTLPRREEALDLYRTLRGKLHPLVCVPLAPAAYSTDGSGNQVFGDCEKVVLFGRMDPGRMVEGMTTGNMAEWSIGVQEDPFTEPLV